MPPLPVARLYPQWRLGVGLDRLRLGYRTDIRESRPDRGSQRDRRCRRAREYAGFSRKNWAISSSRLLFRLALPRSAGISISAAWSRRARGNMRDFKEELGDLLLQVVVQAHIAEGRGDFDFGGVVEAIAQKMSGVIRMCLPRRVIVHRFARRPSRRCSARPARLDLRLERCQMGARENSPLKSKSRSMPGHLPPSRRKSAMCFSPPRAK
jgi:hypothetical protein